MADTCAGGCPRKPTAGEEGRATTAVPPLLPEAAAVQLPSLASDGSLFTRRPEGHRRTAAREWPGQTLMWENNPMSAAAEEALRGYVYRLYDRDIKQDISDQIGVWEGAADDVV